MAKMIDADLVLAEIDQAIEFAREESNFTMISALLVFREMIEKQSFFVPTVDRR